jgi:hypothetical protein
MMADHLRDSFQLLLMVFHFLQRRHVCTRRRVYLIMCAYLGMSSHGYLHGYVQTWMPTWVCTDVDAYMGMYRHGCLHGYVQTWMPT